MILKIQNSINDVWLLYDNIRRIKYQFFEYDLETDTLFPKNIKTNDKSNLITYVPDIMCINFEKDRELNDYKNAYRPFDNILGIFMTFKNDENKLLITDSWSVYIMSDEGKTIEKI